MGVLTTLKGLPRAYNRDFQNATPPVWDAVDAVTEAVEVAAGGVATATWNEAALAAAAGANFSTATGVADLLAMEGVPFRTAHELVARAGEQGADYAALDAAAGDVLGEPLDAYVDRSAVEAALDPAESVAMRDSTGGPAPDAVAAAIADAEASLTADVDELYATQGALDDAHSRLLAEVNAYA
jgi:argininosuccinate lyase